MRMSLPIFAIAIAATAFPVASQQYLPGRSRAPEARVCCAPQGAWAYPPDLDPFSALFGTLAGDWRSVCAISPDDCQTPRYAGQICRVPVPDSMPDFVTGISCDSPQNCTQCVRARRACRTPAGTFTAADGAYYGAKPGTPCSMQTTNGDYFEGTIIVPE